MKIIPIIVALFLSSVAFSQDLDLRKPLSEAQFNQFHQTMMKEAEKDPQTTGRQAKEMLIGMLGLEDKKDITPAFDASVGYNVAAVILLVGNQNKVKASDEAISGFQKESQLTANDLKAKPEQAAFIEQLTSLLVLENRRLK
jgi:hypothetical protein